MPDLNDFYAFKMTTSGSGFGGGRNNNSTNSSGNSGCTTALIVLAIIDWVLWIIGKFLA